ncbi:MAG: hypothetical protein ACUVSK_12745, partial [Desulfotomaculales bacterium]
GRDGPLAEPFPGVACPGEGRCRFCVWAPRAETVAVHFTAPRERLVPLARRERGYHCGEAAEVEPGSLYFYLLDGCQERPDPASRSQPEGVHGSSQVVDTRTLVGNLPSERTGRRRAPAGGTAGAPGLRARRKSI